MNYRTAAFLLLIFTVLSHLCPSLAVAGQADLSAAEQRFVALLAKKDFRRLSQLVDKVASSGNPEACELLIKYTLRGDDEALDRKVVKVLSEISDPQGCEVIYRHIKRNPRYQTRLALLEVAFRQSNDANALSALVHALADPRRAVVFTALYWLREARDPRAVSALIDLLEREARRPWDRRYHDVQRTLTVITGESFDNAIDWRSYWEAWKAGQQGRTAKEVQGKGKTVVVRPTKRKFFGVELNSDRVVFLIDVSSSMEIKDPPMEAIKVGSRLMRRKMDVDPDSLPEDRQRIYRVKKELIRTIKSMSEKVRFTVISFSHEIGFLDGPTLVPATNKNKIRAIQWVRRLGALGETWTDTAFKELFEKVRGFDTILLLSDGAPRRDNIPLDEDEVLSGILALNRFARCRIHTIGFQQTGANLKRFLKKLAEQNDGTYTALE